MLCPRLPGLTPGQSRTHRTFKTPERARLQHRDALCSLELFSGTHWRLKGAERLPSSLLLYTTIPD